MNLFRIIYPAWEIESGNILCSNKCNFWVIVSKLSLSEIANAACIIKGPLSTSGSTKCTEQPVIFESFVIASLIALPPLKEGSNAIKDAIVNDSRITGCSVHFVEPEVDSGPLIMQAALAISDKDNLETLTKKIHLLEHKILPLSISQAGYIIRNKFMDND